MTDMTMSEIAADDDTQFARRVQEARDALRILNSLPEEDLLDVFEGQQLLPEVMGQLLIEAIEVDGKMTSIQKSYWMRVGVWMGPEWIDAFRRAGAFMAKVDEF